VDGQRYVGGYLGLDITQRLFACFDQLELDDRTARALSRPD
jgi:aminopeptidase N